MIRSYCDRCEVPMPQRSITRDVSVLDGWAVRLVPFNLAGQSNVEFCRRCATEIAWAGDELDISGDGVTS